MWPVASPDPRDLEGRGYGVWGEAARSRPLGLYTIYSCEKSLFSLQFTEFDQPGHGSFLRVSWFTVADWQGSWLLGARPPIYSKNISRRICANLRIGSGGGWGAVAPFASPVATLMHVTFGIYKLSCRDAPCRDAPWFIQCYALPKTFYRPRTFMSFRAS